MWLSCDFWRFRRHFFLGRRFIYLIMWLEQSQPINFSSKTRKLRINTHQLGPQPIKVGEISQTLSFSQSQHLIHKLLTPLPLSKSLKHHTFSFYFILFYSRHVSRQFPLQHSVMLWSIVPLSILMTIQAIKESCFWYII